MQALLHTFTPFMFVATPTLTLEDLTADHHLLDEVFHGAAVVVLPCDEGKTCKAGACPHASACHHQVREHFHRTMFSVVGHFGREDKYLRKHLPLERYQQHTKSHADLSAALQAAIISYGAHHNVKRAFADIADIAHRIDLHHRTEDNEFLSHTPKDRNGKPPAPLLPAPPATGNPQIDAEHARLYDILHAVHSLCGNEIPVCESCSPEKQQRCAETAIELLTDALKFMVEHFRHEEKDFRDTLESETIRSHVEDHAAISRRMTRLIGDYEDNNTALVLFRLAEALRGWLNDHIVRYDLPLYRQTSARKAA